MEKLIEFKKEREPMNGISVRALSTTFEESEVSVGEDRVIKGYAIVWNSINSFSEQLIKGSTQKSLDERGVDADKNQIAFLYQHKLDTPIAKLQVLREDDKGLYFEAKIVNTRLGDEVIELINSGVLRQLSYGFNYVWDQTEYDSATDSYILKEIILLEISLVTLSADENAQLRSLDFISAQKSLIIKEFPVDFMRSLEQLMHISSKISEIKEDNQSDENTDKIITFI